MTDILEIPFTQEIPSTVTYLRGIIIHLHLQLVPGLKQEGEVMRTNIQSIRTLGGMKSHMLTHIKT